MTPNVEAELQAWREAHEHLSKAVLVAKEAVEVAKAQRRYWLEEICANLTHDGRLVNTSVWKKATKTTRKAPAKRKSGENASGTKRKRKADNAGQDAKQDPKKAKKKDSIRVTLKVPKTEAAIVPNISMAQIYGDQQGMDEQRSVMSPMQLAQSDETQSSFPPPAVREEEKEHVFVSLRIVLIFLSLILFAFFRSFHILAEEKFFHRAEEKFCHRRTCLTLPHSKIQLPA